MAFESRLCARLLSLLELPLQYGQPHCRGYSTDNSPAMDIYRSEQSRVSNAEGQAALSAHRAP